jgi:type IV pilus assembly protein PilQ
MMLSTLRLATIGALVLTATAATRFAPPESTAYRPRATEGSVLSLRVVPSAGRTEVVIGWTGEVKVQDFTLTAPDRIVIDLTPATLNLPVGAAYDRVTRGGVTNVRYSQFSANTVRIALQLDTRRAYSVERKTGEVHVSVDGPAADFAAWSIGRPSTSVPAIATVPLPADALPVAPQPPVSNVSAGLPSMSDISAVRSTSAPGLGAAAAWSGSALTGLARQTQSQQARISIDFNRTTVDEILKVFGNFSGRVFIPVRGVGALTFTGTIPNLPWDVALQGILNSLGLDAWENDNHIFIVDTFEAIASKAATQPLATRAVRLNWARPATIAPMVEQLLTRDCPRMAAAAAAAGAAPPAAAAATPPAGAAAGAEPPPAAAAQTPAPFQPSVTAPMSLACPTRGRVIADSIGGRILITDIPAALNELEAYARTLDLRPAQVNLRAKVILVDRTGLEAMGLRYDLGSRGQFFNAVVPRLDSLGNALTGDGQIGLGGNMLSAIANATQRVPSATVAMVYSTAIGGFDFTSLLEALQQTSILDVQGEPSVMALNNMEAQLVAGTQTPLRTIDAGGIAGGASAKSVTQIKETGVKLFVTPRVTNNGEIVMKIHLENSDATFSGPDAVTFPTQSVDNTIIVRDGETAVLGGLTQTSVRVTKSGIPFLVDLPIVGRLFGVTQTQQTKRDLLLLITPHIIDPGQWDPSVPAIKPPGLERH